MGLYTVGSIEVSKFVVTSGGKKGLWIKATAKTITLCDEDPEYYQNNGNTQFIGIGPQGQVVKWEDLPLGSGYYKCTQFIGAKTIDCDAELVREYYYPDNKAAHHKLLNLIKNTEV